MKLYTTINHYHSYYGKKIIKMGIKEISIEIHNKIYKKYMKLLRHIEYKKMRNIDLLLLKDLIFIISKYEEESFKNSLNSIKKLLKKNLKDRNTSYKKSINCINYTRMLEDDDYYKLLVDDYLKILTYLKNNSDQSLNKILKVIKENNYFSIKDICNNTYGNNHVEIFKELKNNLIKNKDYIIVVIDNHNIFITADEWKKEKICQK